MSDPRLRALLGLGACLIAALVFTVVGSILYSEGAALEESHRTYVTTCPQPPQCGWPPGWAQAFGEGAALETWGEVCFVVAIGLIALGFVFFGPEALTVRVEAFRRVNR